MDKKKIGTKSIKTSSKSWANTSHTIILGVRRHLPTFAAIITYNAYNIRGPIVLTSLLSDIENQKIEKQSGGRSGSGSITTRSILSTVFER